METNHATELGQTTVAKFLGTVGYDDCSGEDACAHCRLSLTRRAAVLPANASFRVAFIAHRLFGAKLYPGDEIVNRGEHSQ
jgi:hypothetical protein